MQDLRSDTVIAVRVPPSDSEEILLMLPDTQSNVMILTPEAAERVRHALTPLPEPMLVHFGPAELACPRYKFRKGCAQWADSRDGDEVSTSSIW